jgi:DNA-binding response OmpR family regulator
MRRLGPRRRGREAVATGLRRTGLAVDVALDGEAALEHLAVNDYQVVVLDRDLPGVQGDEVCRTLVAAGIATRVLMLTAAAAVADRVGGLGLGADDYLVKPFAFAELVARVMALARRPGGRVPPLLACGQIRLDTARRRAWRGGRPLDLTRKELGVLEMLLRADGAAVSAEALLESVWDEHADSFTQTVKTTIWRLRRKLGDPAVITTAVGGGYRLE